MRISCVWLLILLFGSSVAGCHHRYASITAVGLSPLNQGEPEGIPYYLPKPLLVIAKNVRHIDEAKVGLNHPPPIPNGFDNQASYADIKANVTTPGDGSKSIAAADTGETDSTSKFDEDKRDLPSTKERMTPNDRVNDGIAPDSFYTYQIVMVPDLSQKYGLRIRGGPGEMRAAMNLVNGWMYTGMGPFYLKDSSTAQNRMAFGVGAMFAGRGTADVLNEVNGLVRAGDPGGKENAAANPPAIESDDYIDRMTGLARALQSQTRVPQTMLNYSEIFIYEPRLHSDGSTQWNLIAHHQFDRHYFAPGADENAVELMREMLGLPKTKAASEPGKAAEAPAGNSPAAKQPDTAPDDDSSRPDSAPAPARTSRDEPPPPADFPPLANPAVRLSPGAPFRPGATIQD